MTILSVLVLFILIGGAVTRWVGAVSSFDKRKTDDKADVFGLVWYSAELVALAVLLHFFYCVPV